MIVTFLSLVHVDAMTEQSLYVTQFDPPRYLR